MLGLLGAESHVLVRYASKPTYSTVKPAGSSGAMFTSASPPGGCDTRATWTTPRAMSCSRPLCKKPSVRLPGTFVPDCRRIPKLRCGLRANEIPSGADAANAEYDAIAG